MAAQFPVLTTMNELSAIGNITLHVDGLRSRERQIEVD